MSYTRKRKNNRNSWTNGSGKTTLIKILAGILNKNDGEVTISGKSIGIETKKIVSYLPERTYFFTKYESKRYN